MDKKTEGKVKALGSINYVFTGIWMVYSLLFLNEEWAHSGGCSGGICKSDAYMVPLMLASFGLFAIFFFGSFYAFANFKNCSEKIKRHYRSSFLCAVLATLIGVLIHVYISIYLLR